MINWSIPGYQGIVAILEVMESRGVAQYRVWMLCFPFLIASRKLVRILNLPTFSSLINYPTPVLPFLDLAKGVLVARKPSLHSKDLWSLSHSLSHRQSSDEMVILFCWLYRLSWSTIFNCRTESNIGSNFECRTRRACPTYAWRTCLLVGSSSMTWQLLACS